MKKSMINSTNVLEYWAVLVFIISMGSLYFQILRMPLTALMLIATAFLLVIKNGRISLQNVKFAVLLAAVFFFNTILNLENGLRINDVIILFINMFYIIILQSNMSFRAFKQKYVAIMSFEAIISIICFTWVDILKISSLPLQHFEGGKINGYYLTPFYTIGWANIPVFGRNAGMFIEPGAHQIFLNFALLFLLSDEKLLGYNKNRFLRNTIILIITILTTQSTTGYMCLAIVLVSIAFAKKTLIRSNKYKIMAVVLLIVLLVIENQTHVIKDRFDGRFTHQGSYQTRYNDTASGYLIAFSKPIGGYGVFQSNQAKILAAYNIGNISNGLADFAIRGGIILTTLLLIIMYIRIKKLFPYGFIFSLIVFTLYMFCVNSEGVFLNPLFLSFLFPCWRKTHLMGVHTSGRYFNTYKELKVKSDSI